MGKYGFFSGSLKKQLTFHAVHFTLNCFVRLVTMYAFSNMLLMKDGTLPIACGINSIHKTCQ